MGVKPAKNRLLEFYHRHKGTPSFEIQPGPPPPAVPRFLCTVTIPGIDCKEGAFQTQVRQYSVGVSVQLSMSACLLGMARSSGCELASDF